MSKNTLMILLAAVILSSTAAAQSLWPTDPTQMLPICTLLGEDLIPQSHAFSNGNTLVVWKRFDPLYYQIIDPDGYNILPENGVSLNLDDYDNNLFKLIYSDSNSVIVVFQDDRTGANEFDIYAQKLNSSGERLWGPNGILICDIVDLDIWIADAVSDSTGGAFVQIYGYTPELGWAYMQHIEANGNLPWGPNGVLMRHGTGYAGLAGIVPDLQGGVLSIWDDYPTQVTGPYNRKQHIDAQGNLLYGMNGAPFLYLSGGQAGCGIEEAVSDGEGGGIWQLNNGQECLLKVLRMGFDGHTIWEDFNQSPWMVRGDLKLIYNPYDNHYWIINEEMEPFQQGAPYLYCFDVDGNFLISGLQLAEEEMMIEEIGMGISVGGIIAAYMIQRYYPSTILLNAQKTDTTQVLYWGDRNGINISSHINGFEDNQVTEDLFGGAIVVSETPVTLNPMNRNIYARRVLADGTLGGLPEIELAISIAGNDIVLNWNDINIAEYYNIYISEDAYNFSSLPDTTVTDTTFIDTNAVAGGNRFYRVTFGN